MGLILGLIRMGAAARRCTIALRHICAPGPDNFPAAELVKIISKCNERTHSVRPLAEFPIRGTSWVPLATYGFLL